MKKLKKIQIDKIKLRLLLIILSGTVALGGLAYFIIGLLNKKQKTYDIKDVITSEEENTYFDDFMLEDLEKELIELQKYIELSNELEKLIGKKYIIEDESLKNEQLKSPEEIKVLFDSYKENKKDVEVLMELKIQDSLTNLYLKTDGYNILSETLLHALKIEMVDAYGFDKETSKKILDNISIPSYNEMNWGNPEKRKNSIKIGDNYIILNNNLDNLLSQIYKLQDESGKENISGYNYNKDRNELLEESFDMLKDVIERESKFNKMKIK